MNPFLAFCIGLIAGAIIDFINCLIMDEFLSRPQCSYCGEFDNLTEVKKDDGTHVMWVCEKHKDILKKSSAKDNRGGSD